ncbi:hypothetical protein DPEC_G00026770 [Dallia pectoralis]|uniref:Uncharacterized protein n=1 Tax=Dallia pectoralis TaxID=75939 RepID=A0ACC2HHP1_DALPE|nr:hypothetical protein DPEC_G00026770 [Dallia pectoralis]
MLFPSLYPPPSMQQLHRSIFCPGCRGLVWRQPLGRVEPADVAVRPLTPCAGRSTERQRKEPNTKNTLRITGTLLVPEKQERLICSGMCLWSPRFHWLDSRVEQGCSREPLCQLANSAFQRNTLIFMGEEKIQRTRDLAVNPQDTFGDMPKRCLSIIFIRYAFSEIPPFRLGQELS